MKRLMEKIQTAAANQDLQSLSTLTLIATELKNLEAQHRSIGLRLDQLESQIEQISPNTAAIRATVAPTTAASISAPLRKALVTITQGMINQNLLTLTGPLKRGEIPRALGRQEFLIEAVPSGQKFRTTLMRVGNRLRERSAIAQFYKEAGVRAGDCVILYEIRPNEWRLEKAPQGTREPSFFDVLYNSQSALAVAGS